MAFKHKFTYEEKVKIVSEYIDGTYTEKYELKPGKAIEGFMPDWIGEFYAYHQWYYNLPSAELVKKIPVDFLEKSYYGLHDLDLRLAVQKVGEIQ